MKLHHLLITLVFIAFFYGLYAGLTEPLMHYTTGEKGKGTTSIFHPEFSAAEDHKALVDVQETVRRQQSVIEKLLQKQVLASVAS